MTVTLVSLFLPNFEYVFVANHTSFGKFGNFSFLFSFMANVKFGAFFNYFKIWLIVFFFVIFLQTFLPRLSIFWLHPG